MYFWIFQTQLSFPFWIDTLLDDRQGSEYESYCETPVLYTATQWEQDDDIC